jgi:hypothetical protein
MAITQTYGRRLDDAQDVQEDYEPRTWSVTLLPSYKPPASAPLTLKHGAHM